MYEIDVFSSSSSVTSLSLCHHGLSITLCGPNGSVLYIYIRYEITDKRSLIMFMNFGVDRLIDKQICHGPRKQKYPDKRQSLRNFTVFGGPKIGHINFQLDLECSLPSIRIEYPIECNYCLCSFFIEVGVYLIGHIDIFLIFIIEYV